MTGSCDPRRPPLSIQTAIKNWQSAKALLKWTTVLIFLGTKVHRPTSQANTKAPGRPLT